MITRKDYMKDSSNLHREYYGQFVNDAVKAEVLRFIGKKAIINSTDEHLNDIRLAFWDRLAGFAFSGSRMVRSPHSIVPVSRQQLKEAGEGTSCATLVCIYKEATRQIIEGGHYENY